MPLDWLIVSQGQIGLWLLGIGGLYVALILVPLTARASWRSRLLLGTDAFSKFLSGLLFSVPGIVFNLAVLVLAVGGAALWALQPIPRLHEIEPVEEVRVAPDNSKLILYVGGWAGEDARRLVELLRGDRALADADILVVDYVDVLARREPRLIELAQGLYAPVHGAIADPKYKSVVVIGHSVGGLLARWWAAPMAKRDKPLPVKALIDLAVPKSGADLSALGRVLGLRPDLLADVDDDAGLAGAATRRFREWMPNTGVYCQRGDKDKVVPRDSAMQSCARREEDPDADHRTIAAPADRETLTYRRVSGLVAEALAR
ncbi:MAG: hypothetical protein RIM84_15040 [Alphaproteobacteria bacterium]